MSKDMPKVPKVFINHTDINIPAHHCQLSPNTASNIDYNNIIFDLSPNSSVVHISFTSLSEISTGTCDVRPLVNISEVW